MTTIAIMAEEGPITLRFDDLVRYHGHGALAMLAITFRAQQLAFARLSPDVPPARDGIAVVSGHPGPGVRDAFEMVTRCVTRGAYRVDTALPGPRLNPRGDAVYAYEITIPGRGTQHIALRPGVLPWRSSTCSAPKPSRTAWPDSNCGDASRRTSWPGMRTTCLFSVYL